MALETDNLVSLLVEYGASLALFSNSSKAIQLHVLKRGSAGEENPVCDGTW